MKINPRVSVIMPMYNSEKYIKEAIDSILNQTYIDLELIVINDGSKDNCAEIVSQINDERLVFIDNKENHGFLYTLNWCLSVAQGELVARLDDDDISYPTRIEKQVRYMDEHPDIVICGTQRDELIDGEIHNSSQYNIMTPEQIRYSLPFNNYAFAHSSFMMRKSILDKENIRYEKYKQTPDYHMIMQLSKFGNIGRIQEPLVTYRIHSAQSTQVRSMDMKMGEHDNVRAEFIDTLDLTKEEKRAFKIGVLRRIRTKEELSSFCKVIDKYALQCGVSKKNDKKCMDTIYSSIMLEQYHTIGLLFWNIQIGQVRWMFSKVGLEFINKCIRKKNAKYFQTKVEI